MRFPFSGIVTPNSLTFTAPTGKTLSVSDANPVFKEMVGLVRKIQTTTDVTVKNGLHDKLAELAQPAVKLVVAGAGRIQVQDGVVLYKGEPIHNAVTQRILWGLAEGFDIKPYVSFLDNLMDNPSRRSVQELYGFIEKHKMGITDDGYIIAYKKVRANYHDIYTGKFDHSVGKVLEMERNKVDDDASRTCSYGFHFCAFSYIPHFGSSSGDRVVIVKVNPRDVVSIPADYNDAKARTCRYEVIGEYEGEDLKDILGQRPVWSASDVANFGSWADYGYDEDEGEDEDFDGVEDDDGVIREEDIEALRYVYRDGEVAEIEITWADGYVTTAYEEDDIETVSEILEEQAERGVRARIRVVANNRALLN